MAALHPIIDRICTFRSSIVRYAPNSAAARDAWTQDTTINAWLIWTIWQVATPKLAGQVAIEPEYRVYRDIGVALTSVGEAKPEALSRPLPQGLRRRADLRQIGLDHDHEGLTQPGPVRP